MLETRVESVTVSTVTFAECARVYNCNVMVISGNENITLQGMNIIWRISDMETMKTFTFSQLQYFILFDNLLYEKTARKPSQFSGSESKFSYELAENTKTHCIVYYSSLSSWSNSFFLTLKMGMCYK